MAHDSRFVFASSPEAFGEAEMQPLTDGNPMVFTDPAKHQRPHTGQASIWERLHVSMRLEKEQM